LTARLALATMAAAAATASLLNMSSILSDGECGANREGSSKPRCLDRSVLPQAGQSESSRLDAIESEST
jgi:hypothetical protein